MLRSKLVTKVMVVLLLRWPTHRTLSVCILEALDILLLTIVLCIATPRLQAVLEAQEVLGASSCLSRQLSPLEPAVMTFLQTLAI